MKLQLKSVRIAFPHIWTPQVDSDSGKATFNATFIIEPNDPQLAKVREVMAQVAKEKWADKAQAMLKALASKDKLCLHDGDTKTKYPEFHGKYFISARSQTRPLVIDRDRSPLVEADGRPYSGSYVNALLDIWSQANSYGDRINASLGGVQFVKDGEPFAGGFVAAANDFDEIGEDEEIEGLL